MYSIDTGWKGFACGKEHPVRGVTHLRALVRDVRRSGEGTFALLEGELPTYCLFAMFNGSRARLCYTYRIDRESWSVFDPKVDSDVVHEFRHDNGEVDEVPASEVVSSRAAVNAIVRFYKTRELDPVIPWRRDF